MIKVDLHTHSDASPDGSITVQEYKKILSSHVLDCIAITDHNTIVRAQELQTELGEEKVIIGEEISTQQGDIIGLFLKETIPAGLHIKEAIASIKSQGGIVYVPHPFETVRKGISIDTLNEIADHVDLIESMNGRAFFQNFSSKATEWAKAHTIPTVASSDAHRAGGLGKSYTTFNEHITRDSILRVASNGIHTYTRPSVLDILAPKRNRIMKRIKHA